MATNPLSGDGHCNGTVRRRSQIFNPKTELWVKRDKETAALWMSNRMELHSKEFTKNAKFRILRVSQN